MIEIDARGHPLNSALLRNAALRLREAGLQADRFYANHYVTRQIQALDDWKPDDWPIRAFSSRNLPDTRIVFWGDLHVVAAIGNLGKPIKEPGEIHIIDARGAPLSADIVEMARTVAEAHGIILDGLRVRPGAMKQLSPPLRANGFYPDFNGYVHLWVHESQVLPEREAAFLARGRVVIKVKNLGEGEARAAGSPEQQEDRMIEIDAKGEPLDTAMLRTVMVKIALAGDGVSWFKAAPEVQSQFRRCRPGNAASLGVGRLHGYPTEARFVNELGEIVGKINNIGAAPKKGVSSAERASDPDRSTIVVDAAGEPLGRGILVKAHLRLKEQGLEPEALETCDGGMAQLGLGKHQSFLLETVDKNLTVYRNSTYKDGVARFIRRGHVVLRIENLAASLPESPPDRAAEASIFIDAKGKPLNRSILEEAAQEASRRGYKLKDVRVCPEGMKQLGYPERKLLRFELPEGDVWVKSERLEGEAHLATSSQVVVVIRNLAVGEKKVEAPVELEEAPSQPPSSGLTYVAVGKGRIVLDTRCKALMIEKKDLSGHKCIFEWPAAPGIWKALVSHRIGFCGTTIYDPDEWVPVEAYPEPPCEGSRIDTVCRGMHRKRSDEGNWACDGHAGRVA